MRCRWCGTDPLYVAYHDTEWGVPERDSRALFEKLVLDGFQAGLAWITILRKRENFRRAFDGFEPEIIARYGPAKIAALMADAGIVRNRAKVEGTVLSARAYLDLREKGVAFSDFMWEAVGGETRFNRPRRMADIPAETEQSRALSKRLKAAGFKFCGPTIVYAAMQACGLVDDHVEGCCRAGARRPVKNA
ncbi:DNA-3-methyladenine glycosylase I [Xanthobacter pseudotagetidis]|uniref:DNA-3-methyladenine glycosylase I n=1 Tax=Xanthobacter pseudotagetidis TaxID=3119911 RepID=UPI00372C042D